MWIFAEGMYLHMLITVAMFSEKSGVKKLIIFGWGKYNAMPWVKMKILKTLNFRNSKTSKEPSK